GGAGRPRRLPAARVLHRQRRHDRLRRRAQAGRRPARWPRHRGPPALGHGQPARGGGVSAGTILVEGLRAEAVVGVHPHERIRRQPLLVDLELDHDVAAAAAGDELAATIDYAEVATALREWIGASEPLLLERLAEELAERLCQRFRPRALRLTLRKPEAAAALGCTAVGVRICR